MKTQRWVFYFETGHVATDIDNEFEHNRILESLESGTTGIIAFPSGKLTMYANLDKVKCVTCEEIEVSQEIPVVEAELLT